jgi:hypothetical protein
MRRIFTSLFGAAVLLVVGMVPAAAFQQATPASGLTGLGLPELDVTVTATSFEGVPSSLAAGRYLVSMTVAGDVQDGAALGFVQPVGMTPEEFLGSLGLASPVAGAEGTPVGGEEGGPPPPELYQSKFAGGISAGPGQTAQVILDLTPGSWIAWGDDPSAPQQPVIFDATGEMPATMSEPQSSATLTLGEYVINVSEGALTTGSQVLKLENIGAQPHFVIMAKGPENMTKEDIGAILEAEMTGTPAAVSFNPDTDLEDVLATDTQSRGTTTWVSVDLQPGTYLMICFFPDISDGLPHAFHGMYNVVKVA